jgi:large subunit ribosomal protein L19
MPIPSIHHISHIHFPHFSHSPTFITFNFGERQNFLYLRRPNFTDMNPAIAFVHEQLTTKKETPKFKAGDNITVNYKIVEGNKERIQSFKGDVIKRQGQGATATFTVRKVSDAVGVERTFPVNSPNIESIVLNKTGKVRRAKLYFLRSRSGKSARIKEKRM